MRCRVLLFAGLREAAGREVLEVELPGESCSVAALRSAAAAIAPALAGRSFAVAVEAAYARDDDPVPDGAEVAFLPPVSGG